MLTIETILIVAVAGATVVTCLYLGITAAIAMIREDIRQAKLRAKWGS